MIAKEPTDILCKLPDIMGIILREDDEYNLLTDKKTPAVYIASADYTGVAYNTAWIAEDVGLEKELQDYVIGNDKVLMLYSNN